VLLMSATAGYCHRCTVELGHLSRSLNAISWVGCLIYCNLALTVGLLTAAELSRNNG
jgi:hypothetical protein